MAARRTARGTRTGTPIFSFDETPSRDERTRDATDRATNRGARGLLRDIMGTDPSSPHPPSTDSRGINSPCDTPPVSSVNASNTARQ